MASWYHGRIEPTGWTRKDWIILFVLVGINAVLLAYRVVW